IGLVHPQHGVELAIRDRGVGQVHGVGAFVGMVALEGGYVSVLAAVNDVVGIRDDRGSRGGEGLAHGLMAATIDVNFLNGFNFGENDARAIVHLEHLKQFRTWNNTAAHPLHGKVDLNRILIVGHSRGGEAVGHASFFNRLAAIGPVVLDGSAGLGPYRFGLTAAAAIAPTDRQFVPATGPTVVPDCYYIIHGSQDADVYTFEGYHTYERAHAVDLANPTVSDGKFKAMLWVHKANHNQFTSIGAPEPPPGVAMPRATQEQIARVHLGALAQAVLLDRREYFSVLRDHAVAAAWDPAGTELVSQ